MRRLILPLAALLACLALHRIWTTDSLAALLSAPASDPVLAWSAGAHQGLAVLCWGLAALTLNRALHVFLWRGWVERRLGLVVPKMLSELVGALIWLGALFAVLSLVFGIAVTGLATTSGIAIAVIGFALRNMIADVFTGIALNVERPMRTGDWIELEDGTVGQVTEINWRATRLVTRAGVTKVVPNSYLATHPFANYDAPDSAIRDSFDIVLGYEADPAQAERILLGAVNQVPESVAVGRNPEARITEFTERGPRWELRFWVPDFNVRQSLRFEVQRNLLRDLRFAGVGMPREKLEVLDLTHPLAQADPVGDDIAFLGDLELFRCLDRSELATLHGKMKRRVCPAGLPVVRQGDTESPSLFLVKEGFLDVSLIGESGDLVTVGALAPGTFFGELSLLTGAPRGATVTPRVGALLLEIGHGDIEPLLRARAELVEQLSQVLAERQLRNDASLRAATPAAIEAERQTVVRQMLSRMVRFFDLKESELAGDGSRSQGATASG